MSDKDLQTTNNLTIDYGHFLIQDTSHLTTPSNPDLTETTIVNHAKNNYIQFTKGLFEMLKSQQGQDDESRDYDKAPDDVTLPKPILVLPRYLPIPKEKPLTKWEKYRKEKGIQNKKRSRMVYSELAKDWVPRWGKGSAKKIEEQAMKVIGEYNAFKEKGGKMKDFFSRRGSSENTSKLELVTE